MQRMEGKTCFITGANGGIGFETAKGLARLGARVVMVARDRERGEAARVQVQDLTDVPVDFFVADLALVSQTRDLAERIGTSFDRVDVLVNNAGVAYGSRTVTQEGNDATFAVNLLAPFVLSRALLPHLEQSAPARIVNVSSPAHNLLTFELVRMDRPLTA